MKETRLLRHRSFFITIAIPVLLVVLWHWQNNQYQRADAGDFLSDTHEIYLTYQESGVPEAFERSYIGRGLRPILHPHLVAPLLFLFQGNLLLTTAVSIVLFYILFICFVSLILRRYLPVLETTLGTCLVGTLYFVAVDFSTFKSELPFLAFALGAIYFFLATNFLKTKKNIVTFWFFLGMAFCLRPVVATVSLLPLTIFLLYKAKKQKSIAKIDLRTTLPIGLFTLIALLIAAGVRSSDFSFSESIIVMGALLSLPFLSLHYCKIHRIKINKIYFKGFTVFYTLLVIWYTPQVYKLLSWIHLSNFSDIAINFGGREKYENNTLQFLFSILKHISASLVIVLLLIASVGFFQKKKVKQLLKTSIRKNKDVLLSIAALVLLPTLIALFSYNGDPRYYQLSGLALYFLSIVLALNPKLPLKKLRLILFSLILLPQMYLVVSNTFKLPESPLDKAEMIYGSYPSTFKMAMKKSNKDPALELYEKITALKLIPHSDPTAHEVIISMIAVPWIQLFGPAEYLLEQWALTLIAREDGKKWRFMRHNYGFTRTLKPALDEVKKGKYKYFLAGPIEVEGKSPKHFGINNSKRWIQKVKKNLGYKHVRILEMNHPIFKRVKVALFLRSL